MHDSYQPIYDAATQALRGSTSAIRDAAQIALSSAENVIRDAAEYSLDPNIISQAVQTAVEMIFNRPSTIYRPRLFIDGNKWCALYGENIQDGVCGFGDSPEAACDDFDRAWSKELPVGDTSQSE